MKTMRITSRVLTAAALVAAATSCGSVVRNGRAPVFLVIDKVQGVRGAVSAGSASVPLISDVITNITTPAPCSDVNPCPTYFNDTGVATLRLVPKDIGAVGATVTPSSNNEVTITRVHVSFRRTDGRNQEGVDVPYAFDSGATVTVPASGTVDIAFEMVRNTAKLEPPLIQLRTNGIIISAIADITFYGQDQVGNAISAAGTLQVDFGNFGD
jgi:hypothetical protein